MRLQSQEPRPFWSLQEDCHPDDFQSRNYTKYSLVLIRLLPRIPDSIEIQKRLRQNREPSGSSCCTPFDRSKFPPLVMCVSLVSGPTPLGHAVPVGARFSLLVDSQMGLTRPPTEAALQGPV